MPKLEAHLFICTNHKAKGEGCAPRGAVELRENVKAACAEPEHGLEGRVRVNASGCLGQCKHGIAAVIYGRAFPEGRWLLDLSRGDAEVVVDTLTEGLAAAGKKAERGP